MNVQEAVALLRRHNEWRRGAGGKMIEPRWLGLAIDLLCDHFSHAAEMVCLPPEIDPTSRVLDGIKYAPNFVSGWNRCRIAMLAATPAPVVRKVPSSHVEAARRAKTITADICRAYPETTVSHINGLADLILSAAQAQEGKK